MKNTILVLSLLFLATSLACGGGLFMFIMATSSRNSDQFSSKPLIVPKNQRDAAAQSPPPTREKPKPPPKKDEGDTGMAWVMAQGFVKERLRSPSTAKWGWQTGSGHEGERVIYHGNGHYTVMGWVDSQNAYGGTVRTNWKMTIKEEGEKWTALNGPIFEER